MPVAEEIYRSADLLVRARTGYHSSFCVVTFNSFTDRRTLDREGFGEGFFASRGVNAVHVLSRDNDWYLLEDIELALDAAAKATAPFESVSAYGSSMGAYAAIRLGRLAGASAAIALSPQFSIDPRVVPFEDRWAPDARRLNYEIERRLGPKGFVASADVFYDPADRDARHVELYREHIEVRDIRLPDCGHPVTGFLAEVGLCDMPCCRRRKERSTGRRSSARPWKCGGSRRSTTRRSRCGRVGRKGNWSSPPKPML